VRWLPRRRRPTPPAAHGPHTRPPAWTSAPRLRSGPSEGEIGRRHRAFVRGLASRAQPGALHGVLRHDVEAEAPAGVVAGLIEPVTGKRQPSMFERLWAWAVPKGSRKAGDTPAERPRVPAARSEGGRASAPAAELQPKIERGEAPVQEVTPRRRLRVARDRGSRGASGTSRTHALPTRRRDVERAEPPGGVDTEERLSTARTPASRSSADAGVRPFREDERERPARVAGQAPAATGTGERPVHLSAEAVERPPATVRAAVERRFGLDLARVPVRRGPLATAAARKRGARAFTASGTVHLPAELGPLDAPPARPLLAHELVHVAQQRRLAPEVPDEASTQGRALEAEAMSVERDAARPHGEVAAPQAIAPLHPTTIDGPTPPTGTQRASDGAPAAAEPETAEPALEELVGRLYDKLSRRLRRELLVERERAGVLGER
jgi:hypothetical protein